MQLKLEHAISSRSHYIISVTCAVIFLLLFSSCSSTKSSTASEGAKSAVVQVSVEYLKQCILADFKMLNSYMLMGEYLRNKQIGLEEYKESLQKLARRWPVQDHPIVDLHLIKADLDDNKASVYFQREGSKSKFPQVVVHLEWTGNSWMITDDSIFGKNGIYNLGL